MAIQAPAHAADNAAANPAPPLKLRRSTPEPFNRHPRRGAEPHLAGRVECSVVVVRPVDPGCSGEGDVRGTAIQERWQGAMPDGV